MTDREKLLLILDTYKPDSFRAILNCFLELYGDDINIRTLSSISQEFNSYFAYRIDRLESARYVANERAGYIKKYLEGKMWPDEETAKMYLQPQIDNAQSIIDACRL